MTARMFAYRGYLVVVTGMHQTGLDAADPNAYTYDVADHCTGNAATGARWSDLEPVDCNVVIPFPLRGSPPSAQTPGGCSPRPQSPGTPLNERNV